MHTVDILAVETVYCAMDVYFGGAPGKGVMEKPVFFSVSKNFRIRNTFQLFNAFVFVGAFGSSIFVLYTHP